MYLRSRISRAWRRRTEANSGIHVRRSCKSSSAQTGRSRCVSSRYAYTSNNANMRNPTRVAREREESGGGIGREIDEESTRQRGDSTRNWGTRRDGCDEWCTSGYWTSSGAIPLKLRRVRRTDSRIDTWNPPPTARFEPLSAPGFTLARLPGYSPD